MSEATAGRPTTYYSSSAEPTMAEAEIIHVGNLSGMFSKYTVSARRDKGNRPSGEAHRVAAGRGLVPLGKTESVGAAFRMSTFAATRSCPGCPACQS